MPGPQVLNPALWSATGQLRDETAREIARRLRNGDQPDVIAAALGMSREVGRRRCREIAAVIGIVTKHDETVLRRQRIGDLAAAGWSDAEIGRELGRSPACIAAVRYKHFGPKYRVGRLSENDRAEIDQLLAAGNSYRDVAAAVGCGCSTVARRARVIGTGTADAPPCPCGKEKGHVGRCLPTVDLDLVRARLLEGFTAAAIGRELGMDSPGFRIRYCHSIIAELTAAGHRCGCGQLLGHRYRCAAVRREPERAAQPTARRPAGVDAEVYRAAYAQYGEGASVRAISRLTGLKPWKAHALVVYWRDRSRGRPATCACGRPARHPGGCAKTTPGALGKLEKARIEDAARAGERPRQIAARLGVTVPTVVKHAAAVHAEMAAAGLKCACDRPPGHPWRCTVLDEPYNRARGRRPLPVAIEQHALERLLRGDPLAEIAGALSVGENPIRLLRESLDADQRGRRASAIRKRRARPACGPEELAALIDAAVPRGIDAVLRDDVVAELHLAVLEGRLAADGLAGAVRSFVSRGIAAWQSPYGPRSLDADLPGDGGRSLADVIGDSTAVQAIEEIELAQPPP